MFSYSFNYSWIMAGQSSVLLGFLLLLCGYSSISPHISLFFSGQAVHLITGVGQEETASFETHIIHQPPSRGSKEKSILKGTQEKHFFSHCT